MTSTAHVLHNPAPVQVQHAGWTEMLRGGDRIRIVERSTALDPATELIYVAVLDEHDREIGVARFSAMPNGSDCEFAVVVSDAWQRKGLGTHLMFHLTEAARRRGIARMHTSDASESEPARSFAKHLHFQPSQDPRDASLTRYSLELKS